MPFRWKGLRTKIIAWFLIPTLLILALVGWFTFYTYQRVTEDLVVGRNQQVNQLQASQLTNELLAYSRQLSQLAVAPEIYQFDQPVQIAFLAVNTLTVFDGGVIVLDPSGQVTAADPRALELIGQDWSSREVFRHMLGQGATVSDIVAAGPEGAEVIVLAVPVGNGQGFVAGMFRLDSADRLGTVGEGDFYYKVINIARSGGSTVYMVDGAGRAVYHSGPVRVGQDMGAQTAVQRVLAGETGSIRTRDLQGKQVIASFTPVVPDVGSVGQGLNGERSPGLAAPAERPRTRPRFGSVGVAWGLVTEESWGDLMSASQRYGRWLLLLLGAGVLVPALVIAWGARRITRPIVDLAEAAQEVAGGNLGRAIDVETGDELQELAEQFNHMSAQLQASYANLEQKVVDRTRELSTLLEVSNKVASTLEVGGLLDLILDQLKMVVDYGGATIMTLEDQVLQVVAHRGPIPQETALALRLSLEQAEPNREVIRRQEPVIIPDVRDDTPLARAFQASAGQQLETVFGYLRCWMGVPLMVKGQVIGMVSLDHGRPDAYTLEQARMVMAFADQAAVALENARLFAQIEQHTQELEALYQADAELYRHLDLDRVLNALVDIASDILRADKSSLMVWDEGGEKLVARVARGFGPETMARMSFGPGEGTVGLVAETGEPVIVQDTHADSRVARWVTDPEGIRSFMHVPIEIGGQVFGVFNVDYEQPRAFGDDELRLFLALAQRAALAIENAQLYEQAQELAVVQERSRLARDLHDSVTQTLFSASLIAEVLPRLWPRDPELASARLEELRELARGALAEMRALLVELRPRALVETPLGDLLRQLGEAVTGRARIPVTVELEVACGLPSEVKLAVYRIAQEGLNNVVKHAAASQVMMSLTCQPGRLELCIRDDGRGFEPEAIPPDHFGVGIMRERAEAIGARLSIESEFGEGTQVRLVWVA